MTLESWLTVTAAAVAVLSAVFAAWQARSAGSQARSAVRQAVAAEQQVELMYQQLVEARLLRELSESGGDSTALKLFAEQAQVWLEAVHRFLGLPFFTKPYESMKAVVRCQTALTASVATTLVHAGTEEQRTAIREVARWTAEVTNGMGGASIDNTIALWKKQFTKKHLAEAEAAIAQLVALVPRSETGPDSSGG